MSKANKKSERIPSLAEAQKVIAHLTDALSISDNTELIAKSVREFVEMARDNVYRRFTTHYREKNNEQVPSNRDP